MIEPSTLPASSHSSLLTPHVSPITFIGGGNMARSLIGALIRNGTPAESITVSEPNTDLRQALAHDFGVTVYATNNRSAQNAATIVLAVKPQVMKVVCAELSPIAQALKPLIVSIAAGIRLSQLQHWLGENLAIVRCMPNTPAMIGAGATGLIANALTNAAQRDLAQTLLASTGLTQWIEREELMDVVTALSGSGPAYFFLFIEALENAAVAQQLPRETARQLAIQTCLGAARMAAESGEPPETLRERVTSPGGTTQAALEIFAQQGFSELVAKAIAAATTRGNELSKQYN